MAVKSISANIKVSFSYLKPGADSRVYCTFEYGETREDDYSNPENYEKAKEELWDTVSNEVNKQCVTAYNSAMQSK